MLYRFADLLVQSELALAELPNVVGGASDCSIRLAPVERPAPGAEPWDHHWRSPDGAVALSCARDGDSYRLGVPELVTFLIDDGGHTITCRPRASLPAATLEHLLIDQVLPRVLTHRGRLVIHAGCVETPHGAVAFLGPSGSGKSTLCAEFAGAGFSLLSDDSIVLRNAADGFEAMPTYPGLRLLPDPLRILFDGSAVATPVAHYSDKKRVDRSFAKLPLTTGPVPLLALYVLDTSDTIDIGPLPDRDRFMALVGASFQLHLDDPERSRELFWRVGALLDAAPVRRLAFPRDLARLGAVREALLKDAAELAELSSAQGCTRV